MTVVTPAVQEALESQEHEYCHLIEMTLNGATIRLTEAGTDIEYLGETFLGNGQILDIDDVISTADIRINEIGINFSLSDQTLLSLLLANNQIGREIVIFRAYTSNSVVIPDPIVLVYGQVSGFTTDTSITESIAQIRMSGPFADWQQEAGRRTTEASQQKIYPSDRGMEFATQVQPELSWGGE